MALFSRMTDLTVKALRHTTEICRPVTR